MSRFSDVWIVLSLATIAGWKNWERIEPKLASAAGVMQELRPEAPADIETTHVVETTQNVEAPREIPRQTFGTAWMPSSSPFDCSNAPPGYVIIHDLQRPECGPPIFCWDW